MLGGIFGTVVKILNDLTAGVVKIDTIDTVVDRIEVDTTSIESKVDIIDTNIDKIIHPKKVAAYTCAPGTNVTLVNVTGSGILKTITIDTNYAAGSTQETVTLTVDGNSSTFNISYLTLGVSAEKTARIDIEYKSSLLVQVTGTSNCTAIVSYE